MQVLQTQGFYRSLKKLHANQKEDLDEAVKHLLAQPFAGEPKVGDLAEVRVYKFRMVKQMALLAYKVDETAETLTLLAIGSHENFYRDMKH